MKINIFVTSSAKTNEKRKWDENCEIKNRVSKKKKIDATIIFPEGLENTPLKWLELTTKDNQL